MIPSLVNQAALNTAGIALDLGIPQPQPTAYQQGELPAAASPMPRAYPFGVAVAGTGVTAGAVQLEGSLDGTSWYSIGTPVAFSAPGTSPLPSASPPVPARYVRARISTAFVGGTVTAYVDGAP